MFENISILTDLSNYYSIVDGTSCFGNHDIFRSNVNFLLIDANEEDVANIKGRTEGRATEGILFGMKNRVDVLIRKGFYTIGGDDYVPDVVLGLDKNEYPEVHYNDHGWIIAQKAKDLVEGLRIRTRVNALSWIKEYVSEHSEPIRNICIEDPYIFQFEDNQLKELVKFIEYLCGSEKHDIKSFIIRYKYFSQLNDNSEKSRKKQEKNMMEMDKVLNKYNIKLESKKFHDRRVFINGRVFLLGNSFNMKNEYDTFVISMDRLSYKRYGIASPPMKNI